MLHQQLKRCKGKRESVERCGKARAWRSVDRSVDQSECEQRGCCCQCSSVAKGLWVMIVGVLRP